MAHLSSALRRTGLRTGRARGMATMPGDDRDCGMVTVPRDRGMVTVEIALGLIALAVVAGVAIWFAGAAFLLGHCQLTADEVARQHARGDTAAVARAAADAPAGARVETRSAGGQTVVTVSAEARLGPLTLPVRVEARVINEVAR